MVGSLIQEIEYDPEVKQVVHKADYIQEVE